MTDKERLESMQKYLGIPWEKLRIILDVKSVQTFHDIRKNKIGISMRLRERILEKFPELNRAWFADMSDYMLLKDYEAAKRDIKRYFPHMQSTMIYHGEGMRYPDGCVLAISRVSSVSLVVSGNNYVVETIDNTLVRKVRSVTESEIILETEDGTASEMKVSKKLITAMHDILGYIVPEPNADI